jgi:hypothetical protein
MAFKAGTLTPVLMSVYELLKADNSTTLAVLISHGADSIKQLPIELHDNECLQYLFVQVVSKDVS